MRPISHSERNAARRHLFDGLSEFSASWSAGRLVVAAPELEDDDRIPIVTALADGALELLFLTTFEFGESEPFQAVVAAPSEVNAWRWQFHFAEFAVVRCDFSAAVLETLDEFVLFGGDRESIQRALGQTVEEVRAEFATYAEEMKGACRHLPRIAEHYR
ncbi:hypothetical protein [Mycolicibacterium sp. P1-18]|uniref:hypothetical protein n=1 Tax=Mycolicibacterium sp. P1-18 TaxID=2024615 RepID=UPI0011F124C5|nr:hypothetical protein [Mycolicibacterium sp. P1-18]